MDEKHEIPSAKVAVEQVMENVQKARTMGLVEGIREATAGHEIDAEGSPLTIELVQDLLYEVQGRGHIQREDALLLLHPAQRYILQDDLDLLNHGPMAWQDGVTEFHGIPMLVDQGLPKAVLYLVDPNAVSVGGTVIYQERVGRLTGLKHPDAYQRGGE